MLASQYQQPYVTFRQRLEDLQQQWTLLNTTDLEQKFAQLQQHFQEQILTLEEIDLEPTVAYQVRSHQTEIHKQLQLLKIDLSFWRAARQPDKQSQRSSQISERFMILTRFVDTIQSL